jgi:hypothetical protein
VSGWTWHYDEMGELLRGPEIRALLVDRIEKAKDMAEAIAPRGDDNDWLTDPVPGPHPGLYRDSFATDDGVMTDIKGGRVGYARLTNSAPYAVAVEYGNGKAQAHHVLGKAIDAMGA